MKRILGLDLGTNSIGWAVVNEAENSNETSSIVKLGVRAIHYDNFVSSDTGKELKGDASEFFKKGKGVSPNKARTDSRGMRRNLQRYKLRRDELKKTLCNAGFITDSTILSENGNRTTFDTYRLRAKSAKEEISLEEFARVLLMINKKRGYKSSRRAKSNDEGALIDGMEVAKMLYNENLTPGEYVLHLLETGKNYIPDFYKSDLQKELDLIWETQKKYHPDILTNELKTQIVGKGKQNTAKVFLSKYNIYTADNKGKEKKLQAYRWRVNALSKEVPQDILAYIISDLNGIINNSSGYLGAISDRSKELYFNRLTVGEYLMSRIEDNPHFSTKNVVFYRQDYLDEFEKIWENQAKFHTELTDELKHQIRDIIIFYQRPLKSQKGLVSICELENKEIEIEIEGKKKRKIIGSKVCPKSSPIFQNFKIWQILNNLEVKGGINRPLLEEEKELLYKELSYRDKITDSEALKLLFTNTKGLSLNYKSIEGNRTQAALFKAYGQIIEMSGHGEYDFEKMQYEQVIKLIDEIFETLGFNTDILRYNVNLGEKELEKQPMYQLWHLLYSYEGDKSQTGTDSLIDAIYTKYGFDKEYAKILAHISFQDGYGNLSAKAIKKIMPHLIAGNEYSEACSIAGYNHSKNSLTKEEIASKVLVDKLEELPKNSLRNPVVEKILNQMVNVVNSTIDVYGKLDEIRIELARELKKSKKEREKDTENISKVTKEFEEYRKIIQQEYGFSHISRNDIIRYRLYKELEPRGYKTLYSNTYIPKEQLFSKSFDIEHIIPQSRLFDDSFSNKTLEARDINIEKGNATAYDYVLGKYGQEKICDYETAVNDLFKDKGGVSESKRRKLLMKGADIGEGFIARDLRDTQYIAKKAKEILGSIVRTVTSTTGSVTDRLREDWQLIDIMQELNWNKYDIIGLTEVIDGRDGQRIKRIKDWTKRNDHRHHAMDALTIAFTKNTHIQYLNNLNARSDKNSVIYAIENKELERDKNNKLRFKAPIENFREEAKKQLESVLVSIKANNKVVTRNINKSKKNGGVNKKIQLTPRGQLHLETIYGKSLRYSTKIEKVGSAFTAEYIANVAKKSERDALLARLLEYDGDPKRAFTGKNSLDKNPAYIDDAKTIAVPAKVKVVTFEPVYTIRKDISPDLKIDKVIDKGIRIILEQRLSEYNGDAKKAFSNLDENPIYLNKGKGITIKRVTISGISNAVALHDKRDKEGNLMLDSSGNKIPVDFVSTGNNHHVAIYRDADGNLQDVMVSFYEAICRVCNGDPIIDTNFKSKEGWKFLFTLKQNEYFVFPNEDTGFNPHEIDLLNQDNNSLISPNLYRVQKLSKVGYGNSFVRDYVFRHHLETNVDENKSLKGITYKQYKSLGFADGIIKVRINHIGQIVAVGEY